MRRMFKLLFLGVAGTFLLCFLMALIGTASDNSGSTTSAKVTPVSSPQPVAAAPQEPPVDLNSAASLDEKYDIDAVSHCSVEADDYLRSVAKYDFKWQDTGWFEQKFDSYLKVVPSPGVLVMVSDKAMLQNGFGAYQRVELRCAYDTQAKTATFLIVQ